MAKINLGVILDFTILQYFTGTSFGATNSAPAFGSTFGGQQSTSLFGNTTKSSLFGVPTSTPGLFSTPTTATTGLFGSTTSQAPSLFGEYLLYYVWCIFTIRW